MINYYTISEIEDIFDRYILSCLFFEHFLKFKTINEDCIYYWMDGKNDIKIKKGVIDNLGDNIYNIVLKILEEINFSLKISIDYNESKDEYIENSSEKTGCLSLIKKNNIVKTIWVNNITEGILKMCLISLKLNEDEYR